MFRDARFMTSSSLLSDKHNIVNYRVVSVSAGDRSKWPFRIEHLLFQVKIIAGFATIGNGYQWTTPTGRQTASVIAAVC